MASNLTLSVPGAVSFQNYLLGARIWDVTSENPNYKAKNLIDPSPFSKYRTEWLLDTTAGSFFRIGFKTLTALTPTMFAIIGSNVTSTSANWVQISGHDSMYGSEVWSLTTFPYYSAHNNVWVYYIDPTSPDTGSYSGNYSIFSFKFFPNDDAYVTMDQYWEFSNFWLGTYREMGVSYDAQANLEDQSIRSTTVGGHISVDTRLPYYSGEITMENRPGSERRGIVSDYRTFGNAGHIMVDVEANNSDIDIKGHGHYYCKLDSSVKNRQLWDGYSDLSVGFNGVPV